MYCNSGQSSASADKLKSVISEQRDKFIDLNSLHPLASVTTPRSDIVLQLPRFMVCSNVQPFVRELIPESSRFRQKLKSILTREGKFERTKDVLVICHLRVSLKRMSFDLIFLLENHLMEELSWYQSSSAIELIIDRHCSQCRRSKRFVTAMSITPRLRISNHSVSIYTSKSSLSLNSGECIIFVKMPRRCCLTTTMEQCGRAVNEKVS